MLKTKTKKRLIGKGEEGASWLHIWDEMNTAHLWTLNLPMLKVSHFRQLRPIPKEVLFKTLSPDMLSHGNKGLLPSRGGADLASRPRSSMSAVNQVHFNQASRRSSRTYHSLTAGAATAESGHREWGWWWNPSCWSQKCSLSLVFATKVLILYIYISYKIYIYQW